MATAIGSVDTTTDVFELVLAVAVPLRYWPANNAKNEIDDYALFTIFFLHGENVIFAFFTLIERSRDSLVTLQIFKIAFHIIVPSGGLSSEF